MIDKMKKYQFLIYHKDYQPFLLKLRETGVVHIVQKQVGTLSEESSIAPMIEIEKRYAAVIKDLHKINMDKDIKALTPADKKQESIELLQEIETLFKEKDNLILEVQGKQKEIDRIKPLGNFSIEEITRFNKKNWYIHFHAATASKFDQQWADEYNAIVFHHIGSMLYFVTFTREEAAPSIEAEHIKMPEVSLPELQKELDEINIKITKIEELLQKIAQEKIETLRYQQLQVKDQLNFEKIELSGDATAGEKLMLLEGYVPFGEADKTTSILEKEAAYFTTETPTPEDNPPIKLKNSRFAKSFELIANLYDRPNYNAFDLTPFFAPFYIAFFGLCLGDCGYGLLLFLASFILRRAKADFMKSAAPLAMYLGIGTMIFGFLSGTFFGIPLLETNWAWTTSFKGIIMNSDKLFKFALIMGGLQITYALIIKAITSWMRFGFLYSIDTFGWLLTIWGNAAVWLMGKKEVFDAAFALTAHKIVIAVGLCMMLFFNNPGRGFKGVPGSIGSGLFGLYNKISGLLGDMLSYIRLFALGISGSVMGMVFNQLAVGFAPDIIIVKQLVMIIILLFGHGINIFLNGLGAFIHPLRLTFVEFYNNAGFEGGGKAYTPFKKEAN